MNSSIFDKNDRLDIHDKDKIMTNIFSNETFLNFDLGRSIDSSMKIKDPTKLLNLQDSIKIITEIVP
jgi:hypothetical protein